MSDEQARPWEELQQIVDAGDAQQLEEFIDNLPAGEAARAMSRMPEEDQARVLTSLGPEDAAELIQDFPEAQAADIIEQLPPAEAAEIINEMPSDGQADLLSALDDDDAEAVLAQMDPEEAHDARRLSSYPPDVAGGLMVTEFLSYPHTARVGDVVEDLLARGEEYAGYDVQYAYVVSSHGVLLGVLRLRDLLLARRSVTISDLMIRQPLSVPDDASLEAVADFFDRHAFYGVPVTDATGRLVGVIRRHDVEEALAGRSDSDYLKSQGIVGGEELRSMPLARRARRRLSWLSINILLNVVAASVIAFYQDTLSSVIALAVFLPIISDMSGCSGSQAIAVSIRELTLGLVRPHEIAYVWVKEVLVGLINGLALGLLLALVAMLWKGNPYLGLVVGGALALNTVVAVSIGGTIPLVLKRLKLDPALASGPVLTTITDMCGFFIVLSFATAILPKLA